MANKNMPERIWLNYKIGIAGDTEWGYEKITGNDAEYVRADLIAGDPNEPLIAAAPDMYAKLEQLKNAFVRIAGLEGEASEIDFILRSARGEH